MVSALSLRYVPRSVLICEKVEAMNNKSSTTHYGTAAISIHWLSACLVLALFASGLLSDQMTGEAKAMFLRLHLPMGGLLLLLTLFRLFWWFKKDTKPKPLLSIEPWQRTVSHWTHRLLYVLIFLMLGSGISLSIFSGLPDAVFGSAPMPNFEDFAPRFPHGIISKALGGLILLHAGAALMHHYVQKDSTLRRMWFAKK